MKTAMYDFGFDTGGIKPSNTLPKSNFGFDLPDFGNTPIVPFIPNPSVSDSNKNPFQNIFDNVFGDIPDISNIPEIFTPAPVATSQKVITISGQVVDSFGKSIPGVNVSVANNTANGVSTDYYGKYTLKVKESDIIRFGYIGYNTLNLNAKQASGKIVLQDSEYLTDEIIIKSTPRPLPTVVTPIVPTPVIGSTTLTQPAPKKSNTLKYVAYGGAALALGFLLLAKPVKEKSKGMAAPRKTAKKVRI